MNRRIYLWTTQILTIYMFLINEELGHLATKRKINLLPLNVKKTHGISDSKVHKAIMSPIWGRQDLGGPHYMLAPWTLLSGMSYIPQRTIRNKNVHISILNGALWDREQVHWGICDLVQLGSRTWGVPGRQ